MKMVHPDIDTLGDYVDDAAFAQMWEPRGWVKLGELEGYASEILEKTVKSLDDLTVGELKRLTSYRGFEAPSSQKKADAVDAFKGTFGEAKTPIAEVAPEAGFVANSHALGQVVAVLGDGTELSGARPPVPSSSNESRI